MKFWLKKNVAASRSKAETSNFILKSGLLCLDILHSLKIYEITAVCTYKYKRLAVCASLLCLKIIITT